jgi:hypothetical protein
MMDAQKGALSPETLRKVERVEELNARSRKYNLPSGSASERQERFGFRLRLIGHLADPAGPALPFFRWVEDTVAPAAYTARWVTTNIARLPETRPPHARPSGGFATPWVKN